MTPTDRLMSQVREVEGPDCLVGDRPLAYVNRQGDALLIAGAHSGWAWCWCQPRVETVQSPCPHGQHPLVKHRRTHDMPDSDGGGWDVSTTGDIYPGSQERVA